MSCKTIKRINPFEEWVAKQLDNIPGGGHIWSKVSIYDSMNENPEAVRYVHINTKCEICGCKIRCERVGGITTPWFLLNKKIGPLEQGEDIGTCKEYLMLKALE